jgi:hypothetical protein
MQNANLEILGCHADTNAGLTLIVIKPTLTSTGASACASCPAGSYFVSNGMYPYRQDGEVDVDVSITGVVHCLSRHQVSTTVRKGF